MDFSRHQFEELECPVCYDYFHPPIAICRNGHSICGKCRTQITSCPLCRAAILKTINRTLEKLMRQLIVRCDFSTFGCKVTSPIGEIRQHEIICTRRPYKCPITDCTWNRPLSGVKFHLQAKHEIRVQAQRREIITALGDFGNKSVWHTAMSFSGQLFLQVSKLKGDKLYTCVLHIGPEETSSKFMYTVEISSPSGKDIFSAYHVVRNYADDLDRIIRLRNCAIFSKKFFQICLTKRSVLKIKVKMDATKS